MPDKPPDLRQNDREAALRGPNPDPWYGIAGRVLWIASTVALMLAVYASRPGNGRLWHAISSALAVGFFSWFIYRIK
jgi:hypothetical protein